MSSCQVNKVKLGELFQTANDKSKQLSSSEYLDFGLLPIIDQGKDRVCGYTNDLNKRYDKHKEVVIFGDHTCHVKFIDFSFALGADGTQVIVSKDGIDLKYLYYLILRAAYKIGSHGYGRHLKVVKDFESEFILDSKEQKKIAEVLTSVDKVIELTEIEIEKLKDLKKGMMQDLLTKGIGHTKFKDSPIGKIPESWEVKSVQDIAKVVDSLHKTPKFADSGYYMIRVTDIIEGNLRFDNSLKVSEDVYQDFSRNHKPVRGDIVMTRVGSFGRSSYVATDVAFCIGQNTVVINPKENSKYLYYFLNSEVVWNQILNETNGSSQGSLSLKAIKEIKISIPKKDELDKVVSTLDSVSNQIELKTEKLYKMQDVKKGLMQDLLTGKVRVKV